MSVLLGVLLGVLALDASYALYVNAAWARAEKKIERSVDGVRSGCEAFATGEGRTAVLLVHGFGDSPALWKNMAPELSQSGYHVRAIRLNGFAGPSNEAKNVSLESWQAQVRKAVLELNEHHQSVWIAAHSLGGAVTLSVFPAIEGRVAGIILVAPLLEVSSQRSPVLHPKTWFKIVDTLALCTRRVQSIFPVDAVDSSVQEGYPREEFIPVTIIRSLFDAEKEAWAARHHRFPPVLLLQAQQDRVVDNAAASRFFEQIQSDKKECLVFPASGHIIPRDRQWREALAAMMEFMEPGRAVKR